MRAILILCLLVAGCSSSKHELRQTSSKDPVWPINPTRYTGENAITTAPTLPAGLQPSSVTQ